jgi:tetratricopeptide (TPR) repeat protein
MYINLWRWFADYQQQAHREGHPQKIRLSELHRLGWNYLDTGQFDEALRTYEEGLAIARKLDEVCWEIIFDNYCCEVLMFYKAQYHEGLDRIVRLASRAYKPQYHDCPVRASIYYNLADIYYDIDCIGYQDKMYEMLDYIESEVPMDEDTHLRVRLLRAEMAIELGQYDEAHRITQVVLPDCEGNTTRLTQGYRLLHVVAYARGDIPAALDYSHLSEKYALKGAIWRSISNAVLSQAVYQRHLGENALAQKTLQRGLDLYHRYQLPRRETFYQALAEYHELCGDTEQALKLRETQLNTMASYRTIRTESDVRLQTCRLLGRMAKPLDKALPEARHLADEMQKPALYLQRLQAIEDGNYYEFDWQKP